MNGPSIDRRSARPRLLIVDDQPANVHALAGALRDSYELFFATTGAKALEIAAERAIELVLLDVVMPDLDGFEICRRLKSDERTRPIPVVFVTARDQLKDETRGFDVGGVDYITKPIRIPIVRARVRTHVALKRAHDQLASIAAIDSLTGIPNRRSLDASLEKEWDRARRTREPLTVALLDVDHFKSFNDTYGHALGDDCLRAVATALAAAAHRSSDVVARYGGEEFAAVLPATDPAGASALLEGMLQSVRALAIEHGASACASHVTISGGAVTLLAPPEESSSGPVHTADRLLYEAKHAGRDRIVHLDTFTSVKTAIV